MKKNVHIVFALKNSRYELERIHFKKPEGYIAPTFPLIEGMEAEILLEELCKSAESISLEILALNFCGDHVHAVIKIESNEIAKKIGLWKGKTAYEFNRRVNPSVNLQPVIKKDGTKQALWAKSYYQKYLETEEQIFNTIRYVESNRKKHGLPALSSLALEHIKIVINSSKI